MTTAERGATNAYLPSAQAAEEGRVANSAANSADGAPDQDRRGRCRADPETDGGRGEKYAHHLDGEGN